MISNIFHLIFYKPIFNVFVYLYNVIPGHDAGIVILVLTLFIRLVLYPLTASSIKSQKSLQDMQPKLEEIKKLYPNDKQKQAQATMEMYKVHKVNPLASCLPVLLQLPILIALFWVFRDALASTNIAQNLYPFILNPGKINSITLGLFNLANPSIPLAILAGLAQFFQAKTMSRKSPPPNAGAGSKDENMAAMMNKQMLYVMPLLTVVIGFKFPAGLTLYWFFSTLLMVAQQVYMMRSNSSDSNSTPTQPSFIEGTIVK